MRMFKKSLAIVLAVVMALSCISVASAAGKTAVDSAKVPETPKGFKSATFKEQNTYQYADDEIVRAIVIMDGEASANVAENGTTRAVSNTQKLAKQHQGLMQKMDSKKISYKLNYEYTELLNGIAVEAAYGDLDAISNMDGVKAVYIANHYDLPSYEVNMEASNEMTGLALAHDFGFQGSGMVIAVLDTGMSAGHEAFQVYDGMLEKAALSKDDAEAYIETVGYGKYISEKIPFSYDYADVDNDAEDSTNGHGPHVSGIAAGYAEDPDGAITFVGAAPDAQLLELKIFNDVSEGTNSDIYFAALEDAYKLGADVINMSIGAPAGFTYDMELENEVFGNLYQTLEDNGVVCCVSAGNENSQAANTSNWAGDGYVTADYADYGITGSPATYDGNMSIASLENSAYPTYVLTCGDLVIPYYDSDENFQFYNAMKGLEANFVDCGFGYVEDFEKVDVTGKIALISRGDITFQEKVDNAAAAGACAALVYNNDAGIIYMSIDPYAIPAASLSQEDGLALLALLEDDAPEAKKTVSVDRVDTKPAKRSDEIITATYAKLPENGAPVVLYSAADGVITAYSAESADDGTYITAWNQNTEPAIVEGDKLTASWDDAGILYALDMEDGTWAFVDEYYYDYYEEMYLMYNDGTFVGTIGETSDSAIFYILEESGDGYKFRNEANDLYLMIEDGMLYDTDKASEATVFSFYVIDTEDPEDPPIDPTPVEPIVDPTAPVIEFPEEMSVVENADGWLMSDYSSWGCTPSLTLKPTITGVGGDVASAEFNTVDGYVVYSGTSMAAPNVTGYMAVLLSALIEKETSSKVERAAKAEAIAQSTASVMADADGYPYSPRKQGAGLIDIISALNTDAYVVDPIKNLFDSVDGEWEFSFTVKNDGDKEMTYAVDPMVLYDYPAAADFGVYNTLTADYLATGGDCPSEPYPDVNQSKWYHEAVDYVISEGLMGSTSTKELTFEPNISVSRSMVASILYRICGSEEVEYSGRFTDVPANKWYTDAIEWCAQNGLASGKGDGSKFDPNGDVTRQELAVFMYKLAEFLGADVSGAADLSSFADGAKVPNWSAPYLKWAVDAGIISGQSNDGKTLLNPTAGALRCELASILMRFMGGSYSDSGDCIFDLPETITVPAGEEIEVKAKLTLNDETKEYFEECYENGNFVEGYIFLTPEDEEAIEIHATFMGFYGDWAKAPVMEQHDWREIVDIDNYLYTEYPSAEEVEAYGLDPELTYADNGFTYFDFAEFEVNTDINLTYALNYYYLANLGKLMGGYAGDNLFGYADYNEKHIAISEGEDGICDALYMMPMNLRNARHMIMVVTDAKTGEVYYVDDTEYLPKSTYDSDYGYWANSGVFIYDGTDLDGNILPSDTVVDISYYCNIAYGEDALGAIDYADMKAEASDYLEWNFLCTVDNDAPEFTYDYDEAAKTLTVTATDNQYIAAIDLYAGDDLVDEAIFSEDEAGKTCTAVFENVADGAYELDVCDYATNIAAETVICGEVETATVKFVYPEGFELDADADEIEVPVGSTIALPYLYGENDGYFAAWIMTALDAPVSDEDLYEEEYEWIWDEMYFDEDEFTVEEDVTFYALMERPTGYADPTEELTLALSDLADWSGIWAFNGYDWNTYADNFLNADLSTYVIDPESDEVVEYGMFGDGYYENADESRLFEIESIGLDEDGFGIYTIKNADGKYVAITADGELTLVDAASDAYATWDIWMDADTAVNIVWNRGADFVLLFNEDTGAFEAVSVDEAVVDEPCNLYMFGLSAIGYEYYTAK